MIYVLFGRTPGIGSKGGRQERSRDPGKRRNKDGKLAEKVWREAEEGLEAS